MSLGFRAQSLGFRVRGILEFWGSGQNSELGFRVRASGSRV